MASILPVCSPAVIMRMIMVGKTGCLLKAAEMPSPRSMSDGGGFDGRFHDDVAHGVLHDGQHFQNRHAAADQRGHRAGKSRQANLMGDGAENGQLDPFARPKKRGPPEF